MTNHLVSLGDLVVDLIVPVSLPVFPNQHQHPDFLGVEPGGAGSLMIAARRIGMEVSAVGAVGDDLFGAELVQMYRSESIRTDGIHRPPASQTTVVLSLTDQTQHEHVFIGRYGTGDDAPYTPETAAIIASADAVFYQGYTLTESRVVGLAVRAVESARSRGIPAYLDVGFMMRFVAPERIAWALTQTDVLLTTEDEVPLIAGGLSGDAAYDFLLAHSPHTLVVKQGAQGCAVIRRDSREFVPGFPVPVIDTVGAGDCFNAAFIAAQLGGFDLRQSATLANAMGAACVQKVGAGRNAPTCAEANAVLQNAGAALRFPCS